MHILFIKRHLHNLTNLHCVDCIELTLWVANALFALKKQVWWNEIWKLPCVSIPYNSVPAEDEGICNTERKKSIFSVPIDFFIYLFRCFTLI